MNRTISRFGLTALAIVAGSGIYAHAQTATTGTITGTILDGAGSPVSGAVVTATSSQTTRTITSAADGTFRLSLLNAGAWSLRVTKAGLRGVSNQVVNVATNATIPVSFKMQPEASTTVVVTSSVSQLDVASNSVGAALSMETLSGIPKGRDFNTLITLSPGVTQTGIGLSISGASGLENSFILDGLDTTDYRKGGQAAALPTDFIDQVDVQTGGFRPEFNALGGVITAVTKSGTNTFAGSAWITNDMHQLQGVTKRNAGYSEAFPRQRYDIGFTAGGALIQDKLFYFIGVQNVNSESNAGSIKPNYNGYIPQVDKTNSLNAYGKLNFFITPEQQLSLALQVINSKNEAPKVLPLIGDANLGGTTKNKAFNYTLNYDWTIRPDLLLNVKLGGNNLKDTFDPNNATQEAVSDRLWLRYGPGINTPLAAGFSRALGFRTGGRGSYEALSENKTNQIRADLSYFVGNHSIKFGVSNVKTDFTILDKISGANGVTTTIYDGSSWGGPSYATDGSFVIDQVRYMNDATVKATYLSFYLQDQWELTPGLRLAYGFRYDAQTLDGAHVNFVKFTNFKDNLQPRIGLTWDVNNDGKTKVSANFGKYQERMPLQPAMRTSGNEVYNEWSYYHVPTWQPINATYNTATGAYTILHNGALNNGADEFVSYSAYFNNYEKPLEGLKIPTRTEYLLGVDHTFASGWTAGIHGKLRELKNPIEDSVPTDAAGNAIDGGDGYSILWNPRPGIVQFYGNVGSANHNTLYTWNNTVYPNPVNIYQAIDLTLDKKASNYVFNFNYTWSRAYGNYEGVGATSNGQADANITALWDYAAYVGYGPLPLDRTHSAKVYGSYTWNLGPHALTVGLKGTGLSGTPISKFWNGGGSGSLDWGGYGNAIPADGMYGQYGRTPSQLYADMHIEYVHHFGKKMSITPSIDVFNLSNNRTSTGVDQNYTARGSAGHRGALNPYYGLENAWLTGRNYRWGVKVQF